MTLNIKSTDRGIFSTYSTFGTASSSTHFPEVLFGFGERHQVNDSSSPLLAISINSNYYNIMTTKAPESMLNAL